MIRQLLTIKQQKVIYHNLKQNFRPLNDRLLKL